MIYLASLWKMARGSDCIPDWDANSILSKESSMPTKFLTKEGFQKLQEELDHLRTVKRQEVAERLHEAMEGGELIENAEYEAAKNEQAFVEGRIQELETLLATARVIEEDDKRSEEHTSELQSPTKFVCRLLL